MNDAFTYTSMMDPGPLQWGLGLLIGFPLLIILLSELIHRANRAGKPIASTLRIIRNLVLPVLVLQLLLSRVVELDKLGFDSASLTLKIVRTFLWIFVIHAGISFVNDVVFASAVEGSWQSRVPKLMLDLARAVLVLIGAAIVLSTVWEADLTNLAAALGVGSIVLGLALQEPLGNLFAGMALLFERPFALGDWVTVEEITGKVVEINWRSVHIETRKRELRIVPNSTLYKGSFSNLSRPDQTRTETIPLCFSYDDPPNKVKRVILETLGTTKGVLGNPKPEVLTISYGDFAVNYEVRFSVANEEIVPTIRDAFMTRVWYSAGREGLTIPYPISAQIDLDKEEIAAARAITPDLIHRHFPQFAPRHVDGESELISQAEVKLYAQGEEIAREGESLAGLNLILRGHAMISVRDRAGVSREVARLGEGEYFGEQSILGTQASEVTVTAEEDLQVLVLDSGTLSLLLSQMPRLGREIGGLLDIRRKAAQSVRRHKPLARGEAGAPLPTGAAEVGSNGTDGSVP